ncbi:ester cyclase [Sphingomonas sp. GlSt437]|uniref:ester cyclase n=1 Tax=Sphingomonas sp. GlSt437 TaxID=3389970 RepID=UPI003A8A58FA
MNDPTVEETPEARMAVFRRLVELYARADVDALEELIAPDYVGHTSAGPRDWPAFRQSILNFHQIFDYAPDSFVVEDQFASGDKVATRMTAHVRNRETGEAMTMIGINLAVIQSGKIREEWNTWEMVQSPESLSMQGAS